ncbi:MFS transporter [Pseudomonas sp. KNUC1026]|uniref:MFS transporter n=1 Tax=Pseudomonas sp. KNUC1026 TaxID=2893890 RepID=UPI001F30DB0A|nr:MFS transporter [Pseudomonas sp. KNUC1026]UFH50207.1 MFS transporter [Pseudomonas sp. KNUC1026]
MKARLSFLYFSIFAFVGIHMPFWPVWLKAKGLDDTAIAFLTALSFALKVVVTPLMARHSDRHGSQHRLLAGLALGMLAGAVCFYWVDTLLGITLLTLFTFACWSPIMSLAETITLANAKERNLDYGRIRVWGSVAFLLVALMGGALIASLDKQGILTALVGTIALILVASVLLLPTGVPGAQPTNTEASLRPFLRSKGFMLFLLAASLIQGSHAVYFTFATLHWISEGLSASSIGALWAVSLAVELAFFFFGKPVVQRLGPINVLVLGGIAAAARWCLIGMSSNIAVLAVAQSLHAATFGASHFAAMLLIMGSVDKRLCATAQGLYSSAIMGLSMGVFVLLAGPLYATYGHAAFYVMAAAAAAGATLLWCARRAVFKVSADSGIEPGQPGLVNRA